MQILKAKMPDTNVSEAERWLSLVGGSSLVAYGLARRNTAGFGLAALGGSLLWRGVTGHVPMYETLGVNTAERGYAKGTDREPACRTNSAFVSIMRFHSTSRSSEVVRVLARISEPVRFMDHLECVKVINDRLSHWAAKGPIGMNVEWDAEIVNDIPNT